MILDAPSGKVLTYLLTIFSAIEASKAVSKRRPESDELDLLSTEPWDTFKAQVLAKISKNLAPRILDFDDYKIMYFIPRLVPKPGRQLVICRLRLGLKAPALAWPEPALALQNHEPGP